MSLNPKKLLDHTRGKPLGQHFLTSKKIVGEIIAAANLAPTDTVLEVGPGKGILTEALLEKAGRVIAVEKDWRLAEYLKSIKSAESKFEIITGDILDRETLKTLETFDLKEYKLVANIPYYITGKFLRTMLEWSHPPSLMVLMLQKEVADRIMAKDGKESLLSISVKAYATPKYIKKVPARYFSPKPKIDSAIISLFVQSSALNKVGKIDMELVRKGFVHRRKLLASNLGISPEILKKCGIPEKARAENLSTGHWQALSAMNFMTLKTLRP